MIRRASAVASLACGILLSCTRHEETPRPSPSSRSERAPGAPLAPGVVVTVAGTPIHASLVERVASVQRIPPERAVTRLVDDALLAAEAERRGLVRQSDVAWALSTARARFVLERLGAASRDAGPPTDEELAAVAARPEARSSDTAEPHAEDVYAMRARASLDRLIDARRATTPVHVVPGMDPWLRAAADALISAEARGR